MEVIKREKGLKELKDKGIDTVPRLFRHRVKNWHDRTVMRAKVLGLWKETTWQEYGEQAKNVTLALLKSGLNKGDRCSIASENRPEWMFCDQGILGAGGVTVGIYTTDSPRQIDYIINHCGARFHFAENEEQLDKILEVRDRLPTLEKIIVFDMKGLKDFEDDRVMSFEDFLAMGRSHATELSALFEQIRDAAKPNELAILVYTSGTTGPPKGVMLSHLNILEAVFLLQKVEPIPDGEIDEILTFLPLSHVAERNISGFGPLVDGAIINFAESMATVPQDIREVSPTLYFAVPRVWEKFYSTIKLRLEDSTPLEKRVSTWAQAIGQKASAYWIKGHKPPLLLTILYFLANQAVLKNIKKSIGLNRIRFCLSGGAPISPDLLKFYYGLGIDIREIYGQTESTGTATLHYPGATKFGTVGQPGPDIEVKIAGDGEILIKGANVCLGYFGDPEKTNETIVNGWLHTGDIGEIDGDGQLRILDRKKDIIITSGGKNITPSEIENQLKFSPYINDAVVIGDRMKYLTALIMIDEENVMKYAQKERIPFTTFASLTQAKEINALIRKEVDAVNKNVARVESIKKFRLIDIMLTTDDDEVTPTGKLKRKFVSEKFKSLIDSMY